MKVHPAVLATLGLVGFYAYPKKKMIQRQVPTKERIAIGVAASARKRPIKRPTLKKAPWE